MKLQDIIQNSGYQCIDGNVMTEIGNITIDSRKVKPGDLYVCIPGTKVDGHAFALNAVENGASALAVQRLIPELNVPQVLFHDCREGLARMASAWYGDAARHLSIVGITGTNGKTTTTYLLKTILEEAGYKVGLMGTIATIIGEEELPQSLTTPDPMDFHSALARMAKAGCTKVVMEVSAHALALRKMSGVHFDTVVFTNFTQDHLDDFKTMENYRAAKKLLFTNEMARSAVINTDDPTGFFMKSGFSGPTICYGIGDNAGGLTATQVVVEPHGISFVMNYNGESQPVKLGLTARFNVYNALAAAGAALQLGVAPQTVAAALAKVSGMNGRMERVETGLPFTTIVDYAHSPDSLENSLRACRPLAAGNRVITVFGCGGDRDRTKRPIMGRIASELSDFFVITSDNPRTEQPESIIDMIEAGLQGCATPYVRIADRAEAIKCAMRRAQPGDIVLIAGKGHETYQDAMGVKRHFDDREKVREEARSIKNQG
ncbi:MAG: UDP-N-acetylmuramoyl-L-alanyl-D-glutamate--2,6-diaminopimelate ligase [Eubacteriales bacterium]|nr:UDP-N-acetylmuramoyl-L-alanyl-D-glutamate--2,6-diaminopimelate ligase [Eubacteriales bacterium]